MSQPFDNRDYVLQQLAKDAKIERLQDVIDALELDLANALGDSQDKDAQIERLTQAVSETFEKELERLLNKHSEENASNTPDFILAGYLKDCLDAWNRAVKWREEVWLLKGQKTLDQNQEGKVDVELLPSAKLPRSGARRHQEGKP